MRRAAQGHHGVPSLLVRHTPACEHSYVVPSLRGRAGPALRRGIGRNATDGPGNGAFSARTDPTGPPTQRGRNPERGGTGLPVRPAAPGPALLPGQPAPARP